MTSATTDSKLNSNNSYIPRLMEQKLRESIDKNVITMLAGARQVGKSTLLSHIGNLIKEQINKEQVKEGAVFKRRVFTYTLDDIQLRTSLKKDIGFIERDIQLSLGVPLGRNQERVFIFIDEVQKFPQILDWIKQVYDKAGKKVKFFITGSSVAGFNEKLTETLAGRIENLHLYPINYRELFSYRKGVNASWLLELLQYLQPVQKDEDMLSQLSKGESEISSTEIASKIKDLLQSVYVVASENKRETAAVSLESLFYGGLPRIFNVSLAERIEVIRNYVSVYLEKEVGFISRNLDLELFGLSLSAFAKQSGELLNIQKVSKEVGVARASLYRYLDLLENTFLIKRVYPYVVGGKGDKAATKSVSLNYLDPGLVNVLSGVNSVRELFRDTATMFRGARSYILNMLLSYFEFLPNPPHLHYWSDYEGHRVDFVFDLGGVTVGFLMNYSQDPRKIAKSVEKFVQLANNKTIVLITPQFDFPSEILQYSVEENQTAAKTVIDVKLNAQMIL